MNEDKTEFVRFYIAEKDEVDEKGEPVKGREPWRKSVSLGSRLCSKEDITHRCILANVAFERFQKVWIERSHIAVHTKVRLYEALVTPVLLYNCNSWAAPDNILKEA